MSSMPPNPQLGSQQLPHGMPRRSKARQSADKLADLIAALLVATFWIIVAIAGCSAAYVAIRVTAWAARRILTALGV